MSDTTEFEQYGKAKASFEHIYDQPDPRAYFRELRKIGYSLPDAAKSIFQKLIARLREGRTDTVHVLDLGCSYGVNAALLKHNISMSELYEHWDQKALAPATPDEILACDRRFFGSLTKNEEFSVIGLDQAASAVSFAKKAGLLDDGIAVDLETDPLPEAASKILARTDLLTSTGCVGYVTKRTFERLLPVVTQGNTPWIANFVLRIFPFASIQQTLKNGGT